MRHSFQEHHLFQVLKRFDTQHLPLDLFLSHYFRANKALGSKDRRFISETTYGMVRWKALIDFLVKGHPSWESRYALYQSFQPNDYLHNSSIPISTRVSFPIFLFKLLEAHYGQEKAVQLSLICNSQAPTTVRVNPLKTARDDLLARWTHHFDVISCRHSSLGIQFRKRIPLFDLPEFKEGLFEVQDEGSQLIADLIQAKPGDHVLDFCAGSGGKSLAFAHRLNRRGQLYLHDVRLTALQQARKRLCRAGVQNAHILAPDYPHWNQLKGKMDWVLVDAPCSGTGTLRRNPDMKWKFSQEMLSRLLLEQRSIFEKALSFLSHRGNIVYATCSLLKEENEAQVSHFLDTFALQLVQSPFVSLPSFDGMDGFFAATLRRK